MSIQKILLFSFLCVPQLYTMSNQEGSGEYSIDLDQDLRHSGSRLSYEEISDAPETRIMYMFYGEELDQHAQKTAILKEGLAQEPALSELLVMQKRGFKEEAVTAGKITMSVLEKVHQEKEKHAQEAIRQKGKVTEKKQELKQTKKEKVRSIIAAALSLGALVISAAWNAYLATQGEPGMQFDVTCHCDYNSTSY